ncbi:flagellar motor switch protein FliN [Nocardioides humilatus]|uniref:Flagellar motor switch protein FliN n=1 Tax=Nocardioides humilatus TaxID=2607660 RepID=A0A5B1LAC9_9ACTN|nr:flagellar motor switch protein FliN [Nocardioides humilatus]KAA1417693.1 flagellar motor switch protein FliN [Nocardioides humilatus]
MNAPDLTDPAAVASAVATAAGEALPSPAELTAGPAQPGSPHVASAFAGGARVDLDGVPGRIVVLVGQDLVDALAASPLGGLDLAAACQPALDAAARQVGARAHAAEVVDLSAEGFDVTAAVGEEFTTIPLLGIGIDAAVLVAASTLAGARAPLPEDAEPVAVESEAHEPFVPTFVPVPRGLELLHGVDMEVTVELGRTRMAVRDLLALAPGAVLELDRAAGSPADLLVNGRLIARGEVVVIDEDFGLRVTEIVDAAAAV